MAEQHEDFGEKIGGAKKDLWKDRGLYVTDLDAMNDREAEKFVKKDNIWKKPDYEAMLEDGIPLGVVYFMKKARDNLSASPQYYRSDDTPEKRLARQKEYIETVRQLQGVVLGVRNVEDAVKAYDRFFIEKSWSLPTCFCRFKIIRHVPYLSFDFFCFDFGCLCTVCFGADLRFV